MSIAGVLVNHNTSAWAELAIRSLFVYNRDVEVTLTVYDNASTDDQTGMLAAAEDYDVTVVQSGFPVGTPGNSHGEVLRQFVLDGSRRRDQPDHFLFLDADVCFTRSGTIATLLQALTERRDAFGVGPRMSWDGETPMQVDLAANPGIYINRLHPCCALVRNTVIFRSIVDQVGLSCARLLYADHDDFLDTFELMTKIMRTHQLRHVIVDEALIMHAFAVSYPDESSSLIPQKQQRRDSWLVRLRAQP